jgi:hypothetical protein
MAMAATVVTAAMLAGLAMAATVPLEMRPHPTAATVARAGIPEQLG